MFSDLVGSTALSARMDPEDLREVIAAYQKCVSETVRRFGGFVAKYMGDGVLAYFGYPQAHEHDAEHAVRAALALVESVPKLPTVAGSPLQVRVGIATGLVVSRDFPIPFWTANFVAFNGDAMRELAAQFLVLAKKRGAAAPLMVGHRIMAASLACTGDIAESRAHYDQALALYDPAEHRPLGNRFSQDGRVSALSYRSLTLWYLGYPEAALADCRQALVYARDTGQAVALMLALSVTGATHCFSGYYTTATQQFDEVIALADQKSAFIWKAFGMANQGLLLALNGKDACAVQMITAGITAWRSTGATNFVPTYLAYLSRAHAALSQFDHAWPCISEALSMIETNKERWCEAEVNRIAGEIVLVSSEPDVTKAEAYFDRALAVAREQQAKSWELRAAMSMARLWRDQGKHQLARELLAPVYGWFTEGFDTRDLKEAKMLLNELHR